LADIIYHGHSCFGINTGNSSLIIDPWLEGNPLADISWQDVEVDTILLTHGHYDHLGDATKIAERCGAVIVAVSELAHYCEGKGAKVVRMHIGGSKVFPFGKVKFTPAWHSSSVIDEGRVVYAGTPAGILLTVEGKTIYHAGDTGIFGDMRLIGEMHEIEVALLPIGDSVTMSIEDAVQAVKWLKPKIAIPMHYNSFPAIEQDPHIFERGLQETECKCMVLNPGEKLTF